MRASGWFQRVAVFTFAALGVVAAAWAETYTWTGGTGNWDEESGAKWTASTGETGTVPGANDDVILPAPTEGTYIVTASDAIEIASLTIGSDNVNDGCMAIFESKTVKMHRIGGNLVVKKGGKMTHTVLPTTAKTFAAECYKLNLKVEGNVTVTADGTIDVTSRGFNGIVTLPNSVEANGSHGGTRAAGSCYGSLVAPTNCGSRVETTSGGKKYPGGGVVRIDATGVIIVNGSIVASSDAGSGYGSGAGGSVWLTGADLQGGGIISVQGGDDQWGEAGSGGRLAIWLTEAPDFGNWSGHFIAKGGAYKGNKLGQGSAAPGTIYLQPAGGESLATVIVDNGGLVTFGTAGFAEVDSRLGWNAFGDLIVTNNAIVKMSENADLEIYGSILTSGGNVNFEKATIKLRGQNSATISGANTFGEFICEESGKTIFFGTTDKDTFEIASGHLLKLRGSEEAPLDLRSANAPLPWKMKVNLNVETEVFYVSVSNSTISGESVTAYNSNDLGGNTKWVFLKAIDPGEIITWTGAADSDWTNPENWNLGRKVVGTDVAVIPSVIDEMPVTTMPVLDKGKVVINEIRVESGATVTLKDYDLTVTNKLTVAGTLTALGKEKIFCPKDVDFTGGTFVAGGSSLVLEGTDAQQVNLDGQAFSTITIEKETGSVTFADGFKAAFLDVHSANALTLVFAAGETVDAARLILRGERTDGRQALALRSSSEGTPWKLKSGTAQFIVGVDVKDSDARAGERVLTDNSSVDSQGNLNWDFGEGGIVNAQWIGTSGSFATAANWSTGKVPDENTRIFICAGDGETKSVTASEAIFVHDLILQGEGTGRAVFESKTNAMHRISGGLVVNFGGKMTHTVLPKTAKTFADECYKLNLKVDGNVIIAADGTIDVTSRGFKGVVTLPGSVEANGAHGGTRTAGSCYGSLVAPTNCGSCVVTAKGGTTYPGGGVVRIDAKGAIVVNGSIVSSSDAGSGYGSGAGGSVWLTGADLQGCGMISVQGGDDNYGDAGSGGRLAVWLTEAPDFGNWSGHFIAKGGAYKVMKLGAGTAAPGTIYLQAAGENVKTATAIIDNGSMTQFGTIGFAELSARGGWRNVGKIVVQNTTLAKLGQDLRIGDLDMATADARINVGTNILTIRTPEHRDGTGWADTLEKHVIKESDPDTGRTGDIVWRASGFLFILM